MDPVSTFLDAAMVVLVGLLVVVLVTAAIWGARGAWRAARARDWFGVALEAFDAALAGLCATFLVSASIERPGSFPDAPDWGFRTLILGMLLSAALHHWASKRSPKTPTVSRELDDAHRTDGA